MKNFIALLMSVAALQLPVDAGWLDFLKPTAGGTNAPANAVAALSEEEIIRGLKEALSKGTQTAIAALGKDGGYLNNATVKIPMPENLRKAESTLRALKQDKLADEFVATMNHAAEKAVPEAATIFANSISQMTLADGRAILNGPPDAATQFFRKTSEEKLREKFRPIVEQSTAATGVTAQYKKLVAGLGSAGSLLGTNSGDLDGYVTQKSLDGLFKMMADEEKRIRENPVARTSDLLQKVFAK